MRNCLKKTSQLTMSGFTLIELLFVVIFIGLLSVLIISKVKPSLDDSKEASYYASGTSLVKALENYYFEKKMKGNFSGCTYSFDDNNNGCSDFTFSGAIPTGGIISIDENGNISGNIVFDNVYHYDIENNVVVRFDNSILEYEDEFMKDNPELSDLRDRVLSLYSEEIKRSVNYFIVYKLTEPMSANLILYDENFNFRLGVVDDSSNIPFFRLEIFNSSKTFNQISGITLVDDGVFQTKTNKYNFLGNGYQLHDDSMDYYIEFFGYPDNINDYQVYKPFFNKIIHENTNIKLEDIITLPSSYNNVTCRDYFVLTYNSNAQFYCLTGDSSITYVPRDKKFNFNYNGSSIYKFVYDADWNIVNDSSFNWTGLVNSYYKNQDILDIILLSTFDIKDSSNNVYYYANTTVPRLVTNYQSN